MKNLRESEQYQSMNFYRAVSMAEGFSDDDDAGDQFAILCAWQYIADNELWKQLQGFFGRAVFDLIEQGLISPPVA